MYHANNLIYIVVIHRHSGVGSGTQLHDNGINIIIKIDTKHLVARDHNVINCDIF